MSAPPPTDLDLVRGLHARDRKVLARVYGDHHAAIYNLCARILGDREEAKDVTQEVFLKALTTPPRATDDVRLRPWLFRVATNACLNLIRARRSGGPGDMDVLPATHDPYEQARQAALIESSLASINERYRAALVLKDLHGLGGGELADVLEVSRPAADVLVHRARAAFRRAFTGLAGGDAVAPANLALALPALAVPVALQALPASLAQLAASPAAVTAASGAAPAAGVLAKLAAALTSKAAVVAAGTALVAGGVAAVELTGGGVAPAPATQPAGASGVTVRPAAMDVPSGPRDGWAGHRRAVQEHVRDHHSSGHETGHGTGHDGGHDQGRTAGHDQGRPGDGSGEASTAHGSTTEPATHGGATRDAGGTSSPSTSTTDEGHDGGGTGHGDSRD